MTGVKKRLTAVITLLVIIFCICVAYHTLFKPTKILVVNPLPAQAADIVLNNDSRHIDVTCTSMEEAHDFEAYDAVLMYGRGLYLDSLQLLSIDKAAKKGVIIFTNSLRNFSFLVNHNLDSLQSATLQNYFSNPCRDNYRNMLRYVRSIATPNRIGDIDFDLPKKLPSNMFYHIEAGQYFKTQEELTEYLKRKGLYIKGGKRIAFISGVTFPVENNRAHIDTLIYRLTKEGYNVYPLTAKGPKRSKMIKSVHPDAIVYLPMGRLGNDSLINWAYENRIPLFMPFPLIQSREEWLNKDNPLTGGTLNARIVVPEIDGGMTPLCISTQNPNKNGYLLYTPEPERIDAFIGQFDRFMKLKEKPNDEKKIAIGYFKSPGKDALLASGMEVIPSLYNFLKRLQSEGYDVTGLPTSVEEFGRQLMEKGSVMGSYAPAAQEYFIEHCNPIWIAANDYENWAKSVLLSEKYKAVEQHYGKAPGNLLAKGDSLAIAAIKYGNILIFPQPRPALGNDDFKLVHGADVVPPHSYIAPYLYMQKVFNADAMIHFGTHGNLEFTPGKNAGLSQADWAEVLIGNRPHFYFYTTANVGEAIIAKRRSHAVIVTHLTPPYVESGLHKNYADLIEEIHEAIANPSKNTSALKNKIISFGIHKDLELDSEKAAKYTTQQLNKVDEFVEELVNEKITGAYYVMGRPYSDSEMLTSVLAMAADPLAYKRAKADYEKGKISKDNLQNFTFITHKYLPQAKKDITSALTLQKEISKDVADAIRYRDLLLQSAGAEMDAMVNALNGIPVPPAPGGDPVLNPNVLPMGRNMYSINAEATPSEKAWKDGISLAEQSLRCYYAKHGKYPQKVSYTFWAGEFIASQGATIAQALRMLGVEPLRDDQGRVIDLKLTPSKELGRPRINIMVQVSGQLRDIASSRLTMLTDAIVLAANSKDDIYPNFVAQGSEEQEKQLVESGESPQRARELSNMRVFGPINSGYSTGMLRYTESSGQWDDRQELVDGYINNMCAMYGDELHWGAMDKNLFKAAIANTDMIVQPRQSNTWGPISLDHVYEFTGALSMAATSINGTEPDAMLADYRNSYLPRLQDTKEAVAIETRATILNTQFIKQRMKGGATTAQMFGETFRNIFGWSATRQSALPENIYDNLYDIYIEDVNGLGIEKYFERVNPAALQEMTATMLESARKGFWNADSRKIQTIAELHARITDQHGAPCTEFVCANTKLQEFIASQLDKTMADKYRQDISKAIAQNPDTKVLKEERQNVQPDIIIKNSVYYVLGAIAIFVVFVALIFIIRKRRKNA